MKKYIGFILALVLIGLLVWLAVRPTDTEAPGKESTNETIPEVSYVDVRITNEDDTKLDNPYETIVDVTYPQVEVEGRPSVSKKISAAVKKYVDEAMTSEEVDLGRLRSADQEGVSSQFFIEYEAIQYRNTLSFRFDQSGYYAGAAHGYGHTTTFIYDLRTGDRVMLGDLFSDEEYKPIVVEYVRQELKTKLQGRGFEEYSLYDEDWVTEGTVFDDHNYNAYTIHDEGITFYFDSYQVAAHAAGSFMVTVPFELLTDHLAYKF